jgi:hypothetical protein
MAVEEKNTENLSWLLKKKEYYYVWRVYIS